MYNNFWWVGNILAGWVTYGSNLHLKNSWAWRVPTVVQCALPSVAMCFILFFPESPRWLIANDRREEAAKVFAKYHADGDENAPIVQLQVGEVVQQMSLYRDENPWWDFRELYNTRAARYRLAMVILMSFFGQWSGNNVVSYFMPQMFKQAGITNSSTQLLLTAINPIFSMLGAIYGATLLDKLGRRKMLLIGLTGGLFAYCLLTAFTAESAKNSDLGYGVIVSIYIFGIFFAWGWTPLQTLYAVECLENRTRAKGSGLNFLFLNVAMVVNTYGISVGIEKIGWKLYLVYIGTSSLSPALLLLRWRAIVVRPPAAALQLTSSIVWIVIEMVTIWFFFVETAGKTLEELAVIFDAKNPVKKSLEKTKVTLDESGRVMSISGHDV